MTIPLAYIAALNARQQVTIPVPAAVAAYPSTIASATWRMQVRSSCAPGAPVLLDSAVGGTVTYIAGAVPAVCFQWPQAIAAAITPTYNCPFDLLFYWTSPQTDAEPGGSGSVSFIGAITQAGVSGVAPAGADDTWTLIGSLC